MAKMYYLNNSNTKFLKVGIKPASKMLNKECNGFSVEVAIDGKNMAPMSLGGLDGFLNLCQSLRSFDELKFAYPTSAAKYDEMESQFPLNISKRQFGGAMCFNIETINGETAMMAQNTCSELLKFENLIVSAIKKISAIVPEAEAKFNDLVNKASTDFAKILTDTEKSGDLLLIEIITNFNDVLRMCIDEKKKFSDASGDKAPKRKRNATAKKNTKKSREHNYADIDEIEITDEPSEDDHPKTTDTTDASEGGEKLSETMSVSMLQNGQRFDSEVLL